MEHDFFENFELWKFCLAWRRLGAFWRSPRSQRSLRSHPIPQISPCGAQTSLIHCYNRVMGLYNCHCYGWNTHDGHILYQSHRIAHSRRWSHGWNVSCRNLWFASESMICRSVNLSLFTHLVQQKPSSLGADGTESPSTKSENWKLIE